MNEKNSQIIFVLISNIYTQSLKKVKVKERQKFNSMWNKHILSTQNQQSLHKKCFAI